MLHRYILFRLFRFLFPLKAAVITMIFLGDKTISVVSLIILFIAVCCGNPHKKLLFNLLPFLRKTMISKILET